MEPRKRERSTELIANFEEGFTVGWFMAVRESFKNELDIKLTDRIDPISKNSSLVWTQGPDYCFSEGQIFYDSKYGYTHWQISLTKLNFVCQIIEAKPNKPSKIQDELTEKIITMTLQGYVRFVLYIPNSDRLNLIKVGEYNMTQKQFVNFLQNGNLDDRFLSVPVNNNG